MPLDNKERHEAHGTLMQCAKCQRAVWSDYVNKAGRCVDCSPPRGDKTKDDEDEEPAKA